MVVGDIVNGLGAAIATAYYFQPAAGVEVMITSVLGQGTEVLGGLSDGATNCMTKLSNFTNFGSGNCKIGLTNTNYLVYFSLNSSPPAYTGIQIK